MPLTFGLPRCCPWKNGMQALGSTGAGLKPPGARENQAVERLSAFPAHLLGKDGVLDMWLKLPATAHKVRYALVGPSATACLPFALVF